MKDWRSYFAIMVIGILLGAVLSPDSLGWRFWAMIVSIVIYGRIEHWEGKHGI